MQIPYLYPPTNKVRIRICSLFLLGCLACGKPVENCEISLDSALLSKNLSHIKFDVGRGDTGTIALNESNNYSLSLKKLGQSDGTISFQLFSDTILFCTTYLYYTNGHLLADKYLIADMGKNQCGIEIRK